MQEVLKATGAERIRRRCAGGASAPIRRFSFNEKRGCCVRTFLEDSARDATSNTNMPAMMDKMFWHTRTFHFVSPGRFFVP